MQPPRQIYAFLIKFVAGFTVFTFVIGVGLAVFFPESTVAIRIAEKAMMSSLLALLGLLGGKALRR